MKPLVITEGKTDWKHLKAALIRLKEKGLFEQLDLEFLEYEDDVPMGDTELLKMCRSLCKSPRDRITIFVFDRDNSSILKHVSDKARPYKAWDNKVYSFALPIPEHRQEQAEICVEFYYTDEEITRRDSRGKRLFLSKEFHPRSGLHYSEDVHCMDLNKIHRSFVTIVDDRVFDKNSENVALSKNDFANYVLNGVIPFDNLDVAQFVCIFNIILNILDASSEVALIEHQESIPSVPRFLPNSDDRSDGVKFWKLPRIGRTLCPDASGLSELGLEAARANVMTIQNTLESFGVLVRVTEIRKGPTFTEYFLKQEAEIIDRTQVQANAQRIVDLVDDLSVALGVEHPVQIHFPIIGKPPGSIGVISRNSKRCLVPLLHVMESKEFETSSRSSLALGKYIDGRDAVFDLIDLKHLLVAGQAGSGKSNCVDSITTCLLLRNNPDQLKLIHVDSTGVEYIPYLGLPHCLAPVIKDSRTFLSMLQWLDAEAENRIAQFSRSGVRNFAAYRALVRGEALIPIIMVFVNELPELIASTSQPLMTQVARLVRLLPEVGIYMVLTARCPLPEIFAHLLDHCPITRIAFAMTSSNDSISVVGDKGAEKLLGKGDAFLVRPGHTSPVRIQISYVTSQEIDRVTAYWKSVV